MKIFDGELTQEQVGDGLAVMTGRFDSHKVAEALSAAGVANSLSGMNRPIGRELRLGHIRRVANGIYEQC